MANISAGICEKLITAATSHCQSAITVAPQSVPVVHEPNWDGVTMSLTSLSTIFGFGALLLGLLAIIAGVSWAYGIKHMAEEEARKAAALASMKWLEEHALALVRERLDFLYPLPQQPNEPPDGGETAADEIGEKA